MKAPNVPTSNVLEEFGGVFTFLRQSSLGELVEEASFVIPRNLFQIPPFGTLNAHYHRNTVLLYSVVLTFK